MDTLTRTTFESVTSPESRETIDVQASAHQAFANKINGSVYGSERTELQAAYDAVEAAYLNEVKTKFEEAVLEPTLESIAYGDRQAFESVVNDQFDTDSAARKKALIEAGGRKAEFMNWYANTSKAKRIGATAGLVAGGATLGVIGSGVGLAVVLVGSGVAGYRLGRGYFTRASQVFKDDEATKAKFELSDEVEHEEYAQRAVDFLREQFQGKIEKAEKTKKRAILGAFGSLALGASASYAIEHGVDAAKETETGQKVISYLTEKKGEWVSVLTESEYGQQAASYLSEKKDQLVSALSNVSLFPSAYAAEPSETLSSPSPSESTTRLLTDDEGVEESGNFLTLLTDDVETAAPTPTATESTDTNTPSGESTTLLTDDLGPNEATPSASATETTTSSPQTNELVTDDLDDAQAAELITDADQGAHDTANEVDSQDEVRLVTDDLVVTSDGPTIVLPENITPESAYSADAMTVDRGEGLYQTFKEMGIPQSEWKKTLNASGKGLVKMGEAYYDSEAQEYRLKLGDGKLSLKALNHIAETNAELYAKPQAVVIPRGLVK
jgi:hypothetical protein